VKRVMSPDRRVVEVDSSNYGVRYRPDKHGAYHVADADAKHLIEFGGFIPSDMGVARRNEGYRCEDCGFGSWFTTCSRCGGKCHREA
jgi:hypothetical protein